MGLFAGFLFAFHYADSPRLFRAVDHANSYLRPIFELRRAVVPELEALVVTADDQAALTAVATLTPRGYHPVPAVSARQALKLLSGGGHKWKLAVIDSSLPEYKLLPEAFKKVLPAGSIIVVQGHRGAQAVSRVLLERLNPPL
ncbi:MAG: hypothetical protein ABI759_26935 [Candidatus Solibacter sp.]